MKTLIKLLLLSIGLLFLSINVKAQVYLEISLEEYLSKINRSNLEYAAQRLNIDIAKAEIISASVFNNPVLDFEYGNMGIRGDEMEEDGELTISQTISPKRRSSAKSIALANYQISELVLKDYLRVLKQESTVLWLETIKNRELLDIRKKSYREQLSLMEKDSIRRAEDGIRDLDALQNRVETGMLYTEILDLENELLDMYHQISSMCGIKSLDTIILPVRKNIVNSKDYSLDLLVNLALENRSDIIAAYKEINLSDLNIKAAKIERIPEFDIIFGYLFASQSRISKLPTEVTHGIKLGISVPIPLFDRNRGGISIAQTEKRQAEYRYEQALLELKREVIGSYNNYIASDRKLRFFSSGLVRGAKEVLDQKREEYFRGEIHLIEVMDAQRSYDEILLSFFSSIYDKSIALVKLESAVGIWDIN